MNHYIKKRLFQLDLFNIRRKIFNSSDTILFDEAVKCVSKKAYRASFIMVWICAAESLRTKIAELSLKDSDAGRALGEIQKCEQQNTSPDKVILDKAESLGLLGKDEHKKLEHIRDMRNSYAHPTGVAPSLDELSAAFHQVCLYVLNRPAQLKHGYVLNLINSMFSNLHFLDDDEVKINEFATGIAHRLHPDVLPYLVKKVCESYDINSEALIRRRVVHFVSCLLKELKPDLTTDGWAVVSTIDQYPRVSSLFFGIPEIWESLPTQAKDMCFGHLAEPTKKDGAVINPSPVRIKRLKSLEMAGYLTNKQKEKFGEVLNRVPYESLVTAEIKFSEVIPRIITELKSHNWYVQNPAIDSLINFGFDAIKDAPESMQEELGRNVLQAAQGNSGSAVQLVSDALKNQSLSESFVRGLMRECFTNEKLEFRIKTRVLEDLLIITTSHIYSSRVIGIVIEDIDKSTVGHSFHVQDIQRTIDLINQMVQTTNTGRKELVKLRDSLVATGPKLIALYEKTLTD